jgi:hypothetical protein
VAVDVEPVGGDLPVHVQALGENVPELLHVGCASRHAARHAHDGNLGLAGAPGSSWGRPWPGYPCHKVLCLGPRLFRLGVQGVDEFAGLQ